MTLSGQFVTTIQEPTDDPAAWCPRCRDREWSRITTRWRMDPGDPIGRMLGLVDPITDEQRAEIRRVRRNQQRRGAR